MRRILVRRILVVVRVRESSRAASVPSCRTGLVSCSAHAVYALAVVAYARMVGTALVSLPCIHLNIMPAGFHLRALAGLVIPPLL